MKLTKLFGRCIQILLIYFVTPSYQLGNENVKGPTENVLTKKVNQMPVKNVGRLGMPKTAQKLPVKASPIQITPQPLLTRRKIQLNPTEFSKKQGIISHNKIPVSAKDEPKPKKVLVECKHKTFVKNPCLEPDIKKLYDESNFYEETEDFSYKAEKDKIDEPKKVPLEKETAVNETRDNISDSNAEERQEESTKKEVKCKDSKTEKQEETEDSDNSTQHITDKDDVKDDNDDGDCDLPININEEYKLRPKKPKTCTSVESNKSPEKEKVLKITNVPKSEINIEPKCHPVQTRRHENSEKKIVYQASTPSVTKLEINVSPKVMEKLTNDVNDKIFIKNFDFEELEEKFDPDSSKDDKKESSDSPYAPEITIVKEPFKNPLDEQIDIDEICRNQINGRHLPGIVNKSLRERIWRAYKNSEIHVRSDNNNKNKENNKPNINYRGAKTYHNLYGNVKFIPSNKVVYTPSVVQESKPNSADEVICVDSNVKLEPVKSTASQCNIADAKRYDDKFSSADIIPVEDTSSANHNYKVTNIDDIPRLRDTKRVKLPPVDYCRYNQRMYNGVRPWYFDDMRRYFGYGSANFGPVRYEPYSTMLQRQLWPGVAPSHTGIRYYSPNEYMVPPIPNCYFPQSFGTQFAPVSRYQKYLFPCM